MEWLILHAKLVIKSRSNWPMIWVSFESSRHKLVKKESKVWKVDFKKIVWLSKALMERRVPLKLWKWLTVLFVVWTELIRGVCNDSNNNNYGCYHSDHNLSFHYFIGHTNLPYILVLTYEFGLEIINFKGYFTFGVGCNAFILSVIRGHIHVIDFQSGFVIDIDASIRNTSSHVFGSF